MVFMNTEAEDQPIVEARANLSELINNVRIARRLYFLTSRGKRQVAVIPVELGEEIRRLGGPDKVVELLQGVGR